jgi:FG-GAP repeat
MSTSLRRLVVLAVLVGAVIVGPVAKAAPPIAIVTGQDRGWPDVRGWTRFGSVAQGVAPWGTFNVEFSPYATYQNGVRVAIGDVNGDGRPDIVTSPGPGGFTELRAFEGRTDRLLDSFLPYKDAAWWNGAYVAVGDVNGDGRGDVIAGLDRGCCTYVHSLDASSGTDLSGFAPFGTDSRLGARVAAADLNGDGKAELLVASVGSTSIHVFDAAGNDARVINTFGSEAQTGASFAAGNLLGDGTPELVAAVGTFGGPQVKIFDLKTGATLAAYAPFASSYVAQPEVAVADVDGDGHNDIVVMTQLADGTEVKAIDVSGRVLDSFYVLDPGIVPGASLAAGDLDGDGKAEIVLGGGASAPLTSVDHDGPPQRVAVYQADGAHVASFDAYPGVFQGGVRVALGDVNGDQRPDLVTAPGSGMTSEVDVYDQNWENGRDRGTRLAHFTAFEDSFQGGLSVAAGDVNGDGVCEVVTGAGPGRAPDVRVFDGTGRLLDSFTAFDPSYRGGIDVGVGDLDGDGRAEIVASTLGGPGQLRAFTDHGVPLGPVVVPFPGDSSGAEVAVADLRGDGHGSVVAVSASGDAERVVVVDPATGAIRAATRLEAESTNGLRVGAGDLDGDGRDEILVAPGWGGDSDVHVLNSALRQVRWFAAYPWNGAGITVAAAARIGLPIAATGRTVRFVAARRSKPVVASFRDAAGAGAPASFRATIDWGDGTRWSGVVVSRSRGIYTVQSVKRYGVKGRYPLTVTLVGSDGRRSVARGTAVVRAR